MGGQNVDIRVICIIFNNLMYKKCWSQKLIKEKYLKKKKKKVKYLFYFLNFENFIF
jgi:hypothetical protein